MSLTPALACSHPAAFESFEVCSHLWEIRSASTGCSRDYYACFSGVGLRRTLLCRECGQAGSESTGAKVSICEECFRDMEESGQRIGDWGVPGFAQRDIGMKLVSAPANFPLGEAKITTVAPIPAPRGSLWLALTDAHQVLRLGPSTGDVFRLCSLSDIGLPTDKELSLVVSKTGDLAVIAETLGSTGVVLDLATGRATITLNRGDYRVENCRFSAAFLEHEGRTLLVHATDWNRLDISDPRSGEVLTPRTAPTLNNPPQLPPHYLDYFHCGLAISPDGEWIADNGWAWHPYGVIRTWSIKDWLAKNVWESEDGPSVRADIGRSYYWDGPLCWVASRRLAVWGLGTDDYSLLPAVQIIDVTTGTQSQLVGPFGPVEPAQTPEAATQRRSLSRQGVLEFDRYLFAWSPTAGFSVWDIEDGARLFEKKDLCPLAYNTCTGEFLTQAVDGSYVLSKLTVDPVP